MNFDYIADSERNVVIHVVELAGRLLRRRLGFGRPRRALGAFRARLAAPFAPPEDWHEATEREGYRVLIQPPGEGYRHIVTEQQIRDRLTIVPQRFLEQLEVVQLSCMTRKKQSFPCY